MGVSGAMEGYKEGYGGDGYIHYDNCPYGFMGTYIPMPKLNLIVPFKYVFIVCQLYLKNCLKRGLKKNKNWFFKNYSDIYAWKWTYCIFLEFSFIFVIYFTYSKIHHFNLSIFSFGNNIQSFSCHGNQDGRTFSSSPKVSLCPGLFWT